MYLDGADPCGSGTAALDSNMQTEDYFQDCLIYRLLMKSEHVIPI
jgi:hypothetical protein